MRYLKWIVIIFVIFCMVLALESGVLKHSQSDIRYPILLQETAGSIAAPQTGLSAAPENAQPQVNESISFTAEPGEVNNITIGSTEKSSGYKFQIEFTSRGAAIRRATFSEFDNRSRENPEPLNIIMPAAQSSGTEVLAMANSEFMFPDYKKKLRLENLYWHSFGPESLPDGSIRVHFEATIDDADTNQPLIKITKIYTIKKDSYLLDCDITVENLSDSEKKIMFNLNGPSGLDREGFRSDMRAVIAGYRNSQGKFDIVTDSIKGIDKTDNRKIFENPGYDFVWAAAVNKYFAGILVPLPSDNKTYCDWIQQVTGRSYDPDGDTKKDSGDETVGVNLSTIPKGLAAAGQNGSSTTYNFRLFVGPKEKSLFDQNEQYKAWGFVNVITFRACCCPACLINPLAFGILAIMKWMHGFWPHNYGIVIIILVFLMRLIIHPLTKKSQVSMSKMSKLAPKAEEIKKKYANNKAEMNKQMMALYREQGASPLMGMLPMFVQMPIWIALWSAVYTSIALRGAEFLPFWITDLSAPDAAYTFPKALVIPFFGWHIASLNLLPILMGVAFYLQQKLMPTQTGAASNPQMEQQQKMMKILMPLMFPLFLYNGPSGVNLYIMASTFAGVIEQYVIRKHIQQKEADEAKGLVSVTKKTGGKVKKKKPKPFFKQ